MSRVFRCSYDFVGVLLSSHLPSGPWSLDSGPKDSLLRSFSVKAPSGATWIGTNKKGKKQPTTNLRKHDENKKKGKKKCILLFIDLSCFSTFSPVIGGSCSCKVLRQLASSSSVPWKPLPPPLPTALRLHSPRPLRSQLLMQATLL